jgi:hypothetical protein
MDSEPILLAPYTIYTAPVLIAYPIAAITKSLYKSPLKLPPIATVAPV